MVDEVAVQKYRHLTTSLYKRTEDGYLSWEPSIILSGYDAFIGDKTINLSLIETGNDAPDYQISILKRDNYDVVDRFIDTDIHDSTAYEIIGFNNYYKVMEALYNMISRRLSGADQAIDDIIRHLD